MRYKIVMAAVPILGSWEDQRTMSTIPGTEKDLLMDTASGIGKEIWFGYLSMRKEQKVNPPDNNSWWKIRVKEDNEPKNEIHKVREAVNLFFRFMAGEGRDNCLCVKEIAVAE